ncbi:uncharacterized protein LOC143845798 [Tasmannia lanceolata]|uniref:uncharacterized protein LOC143845798 n=1 Tax=Tasmannia lanceolata TaxID=3420 RepID=UPI0040645A91
MGANESRESDMGAGSSNNGRRRSEAQDMSTGEVVASVGAAVAIAYGMYRLLFKKKEKESSSQLDLEITQASRFLARSCTWEKPKPDTVKLNTDASSYGDWGSIGGLLRDSEGSLISAYSINVPQLNDLTQLEFEAIRVGVEQAIRRNFRRIWVESDSEPAVKILNGGTCPAEAKDLVDEILHLSKKFQTREEVTYTQREANKPWDVTYTPREGNIPADILGSDTFPIKSTDILPNSIRQCLSNSNIQNLLTSIEKDRNGIVYKIKENRKYTLKLKGGF